MTQNNQKQTVDTLTASLKKLEESHHKRLKSLEDDRVVRRLAVRENPPMLPSPRLLESVPKEAKSFQDFLRGRLSYPTKSLSAGDEPGSVTLPVYMQERIQKDLERYGSFRSLARTMEISSSFVDIITDRGLPEANWVSEKDERPETGTSELFRKRIQVHELYAKPRATQKLLEDSAVDVESWLVEKVAEKIRRLENTTFLWGKEDNQPRGICSYGIQKPGEDHPELFQALYTGRVGGFQEGRSQVLVELMHMLPSRYREGAVWLMSNDVLARIRSLRIQEHQPNHLYALEEPFRPQLFGYPVVTMDEMPPMLKEGDFVGAIFGNFKEAYQIVDRKELHILRDPYSHKPYVEFYMNKRVGGDVINFDALKLLVFGEER